MDNFVHHVIQPPRGFGPAGIEELESMTRDQLIDEVIKARAEAERAKKGYTVRGGGQGKEFLPLGNPNSR